MKVEMRFSTTKPELDIQHSSGYDLNNYKTCSAFSLISPHFYLSDFIAAIIIFFV